MAFKLTSIKYKEHTNDSKNPWALDNLNLSNINLIVGKNATGKTRTVRVVWNLAYVITEKRGVLNGHWQALFHDEDTNDKLKYCLRVKDHEVIEEKLVLNNEKKLLRSDTKAQMASKLKNKPDQVKLNPPKNKLVLHVRRDTKEFPFLESLVNWAESVRGIYFGFNRPTDISTDERDELAELRGLNIVPLIFSGLSKSKQRMIIDDFNSVGYDLKDVTTKKIDLIINNVIKSGKYLIFKEEGIPKPIEQMSISDGMYRAFSILVILHQVISTNNFSTLIIDDLCEGLDYERARKLSHLIVQRTKKNNVQLIATTNDEVLMNAVNVKYWNILSRKNYEVKAYNYKTNKKVFDNFKKTGLSNFDVFSSDLLSQLK